MKKMQVMVIKCGYATLEVDSEEEALEKTKNMKIRISTWSHSSMMLRLLIMM